ncbi:MAG: glycosyltransferase family 4 protein [Aureliella sp.]
MRIVYLTAGAAGMYCGSCIHDNALARALIKLGHDALLVPTYTPIQTDEEDASDGHLFYGGLNVYLQQISPIFRWLPRWADSFLSSPRLVKWIASRAMGTSAKKLGAMTVSMLKGVDGNQRKEVGRLCDWLATQNPDVVIFSNLLIAGCLPEIKKQLGCRTVVLLQGDDIFYDGLVEPYREQALTELRRLAVQVDRFVVHSNDYGTRMQALLGFRDEQLAVNPLCIDPTDFHPSEPVPKNDQAAPSGPRPLAIGYLARLAPEKGIDILVDAFIELHHRQSSEANYAGPILHVAGWLGKQHEDYWQEQLDKLSAAGLSEMCKYHGSVDRAGKLAFLGAIDLLCVPTPYLEPKGLFVLEALAAGVPYLQPDHGAFPELNARLGGGQLFPPESADVLADHLESMLADHEQLRALGEAGRDGLLETATTKHEAESLIEILQSIPNATETANVN